jgi:hypothetical protein
LQEKSLRINFVIGSGVFFHPTSKRQQAIAFDGAACKPSLLLLYPVILFRPKALSIKKLLQALVIFCGPDVMGKAGLHQQCFHAKKT